MFLLEIVCGLIVPVLLYILVTYIYHIWIYQRFPPGPFPLPIIGNYNLLCKNPTKSLCELERIYGDVFSISLGTTRVVIVNSHESIHDVLVGEGSTFAGRPREYSSSLFTGGYENLSHMDNNLLTKKIRKIFYSRLKNNGCVLTHNESVITNECQLLYQRLLHNEGLVTNLRFEIDLCIVNSICCIVFGNRLSSICEVKEVLKATQLLLKNSSNIAIIQYLPWMRFFLLKQQKEINEAKKICKFWVNSQLQKLENETESISGLLLKFWKQENPKVIMIDEQCRMILVELFMAGSETTAATITWFFVYLLHWPHFQDIIYNEIKQVAGDRYPTFSDRTSMPLLQAAILETLRLSSVVPLNLSHKAMRKVNIKGFGIPKDTIVITNLWGVHHNEKYWENPFEFNPKRWLDDNGKISTTKPFGYFPFSAGPRVCIGESFARMQMFIICSRLIKDFHFELPSGEKLPKLQGDIGITLTPFPFNVLVSLRKRKLQEKCF